MDITLPVIIDILILSTCKMLTQMPETRKCVLLYEDSGVGFCDSTVTSFDNLTNERNWGPFSYCKIDSQLFLNF